MIELYHVRQRDTRCSFGTAAGKEGEAIPRKALPEKKKPRSSVRSLQSLFGLVNGDLLAVLPQPLKTDCTAGGGKEGIITAAAHVHAGVDMGAALTDEDVARLDELAVRPLGTKTLGFGIAAVLSGAAALLVSEEL